MRLVIPLLLCGAIVCAGEPDELSGLLRGTPPGVEDPDAAAADAERAYAAVLDGSGPGPSADLMAFYVDQADGYRRIWDERTARFDDGQRAAARALSKGLYWRHATSWNGFLAMRGPRFLERKKVRRAPPEIREAARAHLLWHMSTQRAYLLRGGTGEQMVGDPGFEAVYNRFASHAVHFGFMTERALRLWPRLVAEGSRGYRWHEVGEPDPTAATGSLLAARLSFEHANRLFEMGQADDGVFHVFDGVQNLRNARNFGATRHRLRGVIVSLHDALLDDAVVLPDDRQTFRDVMDEATGTKLARAHRRAGVSVSIPSVETTQPVSAELREAVEVTAEAGSLNLDVYIFNELEALIALEIGEDTLAKHVAVGTMGRLLFDGTLGDMLGRARLARLRQGHTQHVRDSGSLDPLDTLMDRAALHATPGTREEVFWKALRGDRIRARLWSVDRPEFWTDLGRLHVLRASAATAEHDATALFEAWKSAYASYDAAARRALPGLVPSVVYIALGDLAHNAVRAAAGLDRPETDLVEELAGRIAPAYERVVERGVLGGDAPRQEIDASYTHLVLAVARLVRLHSQRGDEDLAVDWLRRLDLAEPTNGTQFYARGYVKMTVVADDDGALRDFVAAAALLRGSDAARARLNVEKLRARRSRESK